MKKVKLNPTKSESWSRWDISQPLKMRKGCYKKQIGVESSSLSLILRPPKPTEDPRIESNKQRRLFREAYKKLCGFLEWRFHQLFLKDKGNKHLCLIFFNPFTRKRQLGNK
ncbi:hypothetical protein HRI_003990600 [Hibiscus trionum]|uniref:Uncharacterized protein n=1 Tax=Hibiscus trionum TaxID=183268 RepID=A0A9W7IXS6_HIBTR|nr:hypothetical protein HRI_003990600 [Hibiscus trionum]